MNNSTENIETIELPRGGILIRTSIGNVQFGCPPETIKDTIPTDDGVPLNFVLPFKFFNWVKGISVAELEFPIYYNYFIRKKKTRIICLEQQVPIIETVISQSLFGPDPESIKLDFCDPSRAKDIVNEMGYFRFMTLDDVLEIVTFNNNVVKIDNLEIRINENNNFEVSDTEKNTILIPGQVEYKPKYFLGNKNDTPFKPPLFGMTCLGPSSGFDPGENTSGFIIWLNHNGVMIDPPVNSTEWLLDSNVSPKFIDSIILTHCHADHDAGTFQKILEEEKITIYTTPAIMKSFLKKYSALTGVEQDYLETLFQFHPIEIGEPVFIHGAIFSMRYSLHSIPAIGFTVEYQGKKLVYSSDHNNDPSLHKKLFEDGIISSQRYKELTNFPWDADIIFHESGIPPLHTPIDYLNSLPDEVKKKIHIYHMPKKDFPENSLLSIAEFGIENTLFFDAKPPQFEDSYHMLGLLKHISLFKNMTIGKIQHLLSIVEKENFSKGDVIIKKDTHGDKFYIIANGTIAVKGNLGTKLFGPYDFFGEAALMNNETRTVDVIAQTDMTLFSIEKKRFLSFIKNTEIETTLKSLINVRSGDTWKILSNSRFLKHFTSTQRVILESMLKEISFSESTILITEGKMQENVYILKEGAVLASKNGDNCAILQKGDFIGRAKSAYYQKPSSYSYETTGPAKLFSVNIIDFYNFLCSNPGLIMKLDYVFEQYMFFN